MEMATEMDHPYHQWDHVDHRSMTSLSGHTGARTVANHSDDRRRWPPISWYIQASGRMPARSAISASIRSPTWKNTHTSIQVTTTYNTLCIYTCEQKLHLWFCVELPQMISYNDDDNHNGHTVKTYTVVQGKMHTMTSPITQPNCKEF